MYNGMKVLSAHQPHYLPFAGTWYKYLSSDVFVWLDSVQFSKNSWQNRNRIRNADGWQWLTVPVRADSHTRIQDVRLADTRWPVKHQKTLQSLYGKTAYRHRLNDILDLYTAFPQMETLVEVSSVLDQYMSQFFCRTPRAVWAHDYDLPEDPDDRLIQLCKELGCGVYLSGPTGSSYMNQQKWQDAGIVVVFSDITMPVYPQLFPGFEPNLSFIDVLLNVEDPESFVRACGYWNYEWKNGRERLA